jgi:uncharacterized coiled-coil DUF342 family protein
MRQEKHREINLIINEIAKLSKREGELKQILKEANYEKDVIFQEIESKRNELDEIFMKLEHINTTKYIDKL